MAVYDLLMICLIAMTTLRGASKGIAWQLAGIVSLVLCFVFATPLSASLVPLVPLEAPLNRWAAMLGVYLLFSFGCFSVARMFRGALETARFEAFDKHLGAMFGFIKGIAICFVITFFAVCMSDAAADYILRTNSGYVAARAMQQLEPMLPNEVAVILRKAAGQPPLELDPLRAAQQDEIGPDGLPIADQTIRTTPRPGVDQGFDVWQDPNDIGEGPMGSAPRYQDNRPQAPNPVPGAMPPTPNGTAPLSRADFFRPTGTTVGTSTTGSPVPPIAGVLDKVPQVINSNGSIAEKVLGGFRSLIPGNSPAAPQVAPISTAPPRGSQLPPANSLGGAVATPPRAGSPSAFDEDLLFQPQSGPARNPTTRMAVPPSATLPGENEVPFRDDRLPSDRSTPLTGTPRSFDDEPLLSGTATPPVSGPPIRRGRFESDEIEPSRRNIQMNSSSGPGTRVAPAPVNSQDDPFLGNGSSTISPRTGSGSVTITPKRQPADDEELIPSRSAPPGTFGPRSAPVPSELISSPDDFGHRLPAVAPTSGRSAPVPGTDLRPRSGIQIRPGETRVPRDRTEEIRQLTAGIAILLTPAANRPAVESEIQRALESVPQNIAASALRDWQADLLGNKTDPDPQSDVSTPLEKRLQLAKERRERRKRASNGAPSAGGAARENRLAPPPADRF